ncbi:MAG: alpha-hydroxy-acid oxidizing protein [bacterium]|jgi:4-hydroxymandelate oxidase|nr:alpha-hydroxy-acid oxidizing protein [Bacillota bacterium]HHW55111.1 alpha-hydroxy-acid oxidizing protein [Bacillota bacterium]
MDLREVRKAARERLQGICRVCPVCDGWACAGELPGMGGKGTGAAFINNVSALAQVRLNLSTIHSAAEPDLTYDFFGQRLAFPLLGAPMCGTARNLGGIVTDREFIRAQVDGAVAAGTLAMVGDGADPTLYPEGLEALRVHGGLGVPIIKPREPEEIIKRMQWAEEAGALAVGIDIDGAAFRYMNRMGEPVGPKTLAQLREIIGSTRLPVILKGIMTVKDAVAAVAAGAAGIVVSNHGGRALDHTPGTIEVLPEIVAAVKGRIRVFMDGGIRTGVDVLKALALGAEAALVGRPIVIAAVGGGAEGVKLQLEEFAEDLRTAMILTGCRNLREISPAIVRVPSSWL